MVEVCCSTDQSGWLSNTLGYAYYGEYPAAFAACFGNEDMYDVLVRGGADPNLQDSFGNTVLHLCVIYDKLVRHCT